MQQYEIKPFLEQCFYRHKEDWEQARLIAYITAQSNSTKPLKLEDIISFPWDEAKEETNSVVTITDEDKERISKKAELFKKYIS